MCLRRALLLVLPASDVLAGQYSAEEQTALLELPRRELLVEKGTERARVLVGLVSLLLSWCYNNRVSGGEHCVTAAWNYAKLTPLLCWLDVSRSHAHTGSDLNICNLN